MSSPPAVRPPLRGGPVQVAYGVTDVVAAAEQWTARGAGPFFVREHIEVTDAVVDGGVFDHSSAYGQWGDIMVELVAVHAPASLATIGLHHLAYFVDDREAASAELAAAGFPPVLVARARSTTFAFHDARASLGHLLEIYEGSAGLRSFYAMVAAAAPDWDGSNPIRRLG